MPDVIRLSMYQASAICGCFLLESVMNPACYNEWSSYGDAGYGLGMWTDYPFPRNNKLWAGEEMRSWVSSRYGYWYNGEGQVACLIADQLNISGTYTNRTWSSMWTPTPIAEFKWSNREYPTWQSWLNDTNNKNIEHLTQAFFLHWESPTSSKFYYNTWSTRRKYAYQVFDYLTVHGNDNIPSWYYELGLKFIPWSKAMQNCVLLWQQVGSGVTPPSPIPPSPSGGNKRKMWMYLRRRKGVLK